jgi:hypothetical protein
MKWQTSDLQDQRKHHHIPITRCSSVVALALNGPAIRKVRNPSRRAVNTHGFAYDPWSSWQVLNLQCYPDWNASMDVHDTTRHYVNGVEAFLVTVLGEFRDAQKRFEKVYKVSCPTPRPVTATSLCSRAYRLSVLGNHKAHHAGATIHVRFRA